MNRIFRKIGVLILTGALLCTTACSSGTAADKTVTSTSVTETTAPPSETSDQAETSASQDGNGPSEQPSQTQPETIQQSSDGANGKIYSDMPLKEADVSPEDDDYYTKALENEIYNYKIIRNVPTAYEAASWDAYCSVANTLTSVDPSAIGDTQKSMIDNTVKSRSELVQTASATDCMWYIWGDDMATVEDPKDLQFTAESYDNADARPFLVPYLTADPANAKGNMIVIAGGGYSSRGNAMEGYPIAEAFRDLGYNSFVLQRRVEPYSPKDVWLDMQRSVRYIRYHGEALGLGGLDCMAAAGFSGGSGTILGEIAYLYGDIQPTIWDGDYVPDPVDAVSADLDVAFPLYGPQYAYGATDGLTGEYKGLETDNPHIPALFIACGEDDALTRTDIPVLADSVKDRTIVEYHTFANVGHGFGAGLNGTTSTYWIPMADTFMDLAMGRKQDNSDSPAPTIPEEYTKIQQYEFEGGFGKADVTCAVNDDMSKFYICFMAFDAEQVLEGTLDGDVVTVTFDKSGFMTGDAQSIFNAADKDAWSDIQ